MQTTFNRNSTDLGTKSESIKYGSRIQSDQIGSILQKRTLEIKNKSTIIITNKKRIIDQAKDFTIVQKKDNTVLAATNNIQLY